MVKTLLMLSLLNGSNNFSTFLTNPYNDPFFNEKFQIIKETMCEIEEEIEMEEEEVKTYYDGEYAHSFVDDEEGMAQMIVIENLYGE